MKILHISDLHLRKNESEILDLLAESIKEEIDVCIFTGDMIDQFQIPIVNGFKCLKEFVEKIKCKELIVCCGNHDIDRNKIKPSFNNIVSNLKNYSQIDDFVRTNRANDFIDNLKHLQEYNNMIKVNYQSAVISDLYTVHKMNIKDKSIAIISLNFAWCAFGERSMNNIIYPPYILKEIEKLVKDDDFKIVISHYPIKFLNSSCRKPISDIIFKNYDCYFSGHSHEYEFNFYAFSENGIFTSIAATTVDDNDNENIGYSIHDINLTEYSVNVKSYIYSKSKFLLHSDENYDIPTDNDKKNELSLYHKIISKLEDVKLKASNLFVPTFGQNKTTFIDIFTDPILKEKGYNEDININETNSVYRSPSLDFSVLKKELNYIVYAKDKGGKTCTLYKVMLDLLEDFSQFHTIPIFIDMKLFYSKRDKSINIENMLKEQYNISSTLLEKILPKYKIKLLIDNFSFNYDEINSNLFKSISNVNSCNFIITVNYFIEARKKALDGFLYETIFIHDISRTKLREITNKWPLEKEYNRNEIITKITSIFSQLNIHFNYWTVSLFLCIIERTENIKLQNNSELIDLYVQNLLDKQKLALQSTTKFSYENFRSFLSYLAFYLYSEREAEEFTTTYSGIVNCFEKFKLSYIRIVVGAKEIIDYIVDKNIITEVSVDCYTFRLNAIFEYFLAFYMQKNPDFRNIIISDSNNFLSFKNEIELYAGFQRTDEELLKQIYSNTKNALGLLIKKYSSNHNYEVEIAQEDEDMKSLLMIASEIKNSIVPSSLEEQDYIQDEINPISNMQSSIMMKRKYNINDINADMYAEHLHVLGRVFRNLDEVKDKELIKEIFNFIIDQGCMLVFYNIQDFIKDVKQKKIDERSQKEVTNFLTTFSPVIAHGFLFDIIGHPTISKLITDEIKKIKGNPKENQFKLFVLYFLLIESDIENEINMIDEIVELATYYNIQNSIFMKLLMYIAFKCEKNEKMCELLKKHLEKIHGKMYAVKKYPDRKIGPFKSISKDDHQKQPTNNKVAINKIIKDINLLMKLED